MRDKKMNVELYEFALNRLNILIDDYLTNFDVNANVSSGYLCGYYWNKCKLLYSACENIENAVSFFKKSVLYFKQMTLPYVTFGTICQMYSFAFIINDEQSMQEIMHYCEKYNFSLYFFELLSDNSIYDVSKLKKSYVPSMKAFLKLNLPMSEENLKFFFEKKWYQSQKDEGWYNSHLSKNNIYYGYWAFEIAALVKSFKYEYSSFADLDYFPIDLLYDF